MVKMLRMMGNVDNDGKADDDKRYHSTCKKVDNYIRRIKAVQGEK